MLFGGDKKTDAIFKDNCFRSYKLSKPMILLCLSLKPIENHAFFFLL